MLPRDLSSQTTILKKLQEHTNRFDSKSALSYVKTQALHTGSELLATTRAQLIDLTLNQHVPNYKVSGMASLLFGMLSLSASCESGNVTSYLAFAACIGSFALSVEQFGINKALQQTSTGISRLFRGEQPHQNQMSQVSPGFKIKKSI